MINMYEFRLNHELHFNQTTKAHRISKLLIKISYIYLSKIVISCNTSKKKKYINNQILTGLLDNLHYISIRKLLNIRLI